MNKFKKEIKDMRISREKEEYEKKMDKWFKNLPFLHKVGVAYSFWDNASYEEKKRELVFIISKYELEQKEELL